MGNRFSISSRVDEKRIKEEISESPVVVYTRTHCGYCKRAKTLLNDEKIPFNEKNLDIFNEKFPEKYQEYVNGLVYTTSQTFVPQIFICGKFIGGFTELNALKMAGHLNEVVEECYREFGAVRLRKERL
ncbi:hypothetical protein AB6A40_004832 [Gnathostoma spinigerum]|uniref:Glutaredoxin domain-containing protein n=1 Tax=Gnathostoma spinigerum TaxID=75299 RepID=A0ABD6EDU6_9BILA